MIRVLIVGQTPPPLGGQAVMIQQILQGNYQNIQLFHVRLAFSEDMDNVGKFQISKLLHLLYVIINIVYQRFRYGIQILYYPPAGPNRIPMYRDLAILISTRWVFSKTIFHFHAGGISELYARLPTPLRFLLQAAYFYPDATIVLSELNPPDGHIFKTKKNFVVPYGIKDHYNIYQKCQEKNESVARLLFIGVLTESKGVLIALEAANLLRQKNLNFHLSFMGKFESEQFKHYVIEKVATYQLQTYITFLGVLSGQDKWNTLATSDIFCFPTFFESESFGVVLLEAMQYGLPIVSTRWRGIPSVVHEGESGYLVPIKNSQSLAEKLEILIKDPELRKAMGQKGREIYLANYSIDKFYQNLETVFEDVSNQKTQ